MHTGSMWNKSYGAEECQTAATPRYKKKNNNNIIGRFYFIVVTF